MRRCRDDTELVALAAAQSAELKVALERLQADVLHKARTAANTAEFDQLDAYFIRDEVIVLFGSGKVKVDPQYETQLLALAGKAKTIDGYLIEVIGYDSWSGSVVLNEKLTQQRADNVTNILVQKGHVPLTRMLAPGALGEAQQLGNDKTAKGQAQHHRVVVRVLQNKAVAGATQAPAH